jgi:asparagine synthetase B (glutamine-hydrolysing)
MILKEQNKIIPAALFKGKHAPELNKAAIANFAAAGFFLENDTYWQNGHWNALDFEKQPWTYQPRDITLAQAVDEFAALFHQIVEEQTREGKVILALSGGLDSRTLAVAMQVLGKNPHTYSYRFKGSFEETKYGREMA